MTTASTPIEQARAHVMASSLARLLDRVRGSREVLPHLAALETVLLQRGLSVLDNASPTVLRRISTQLASLPVPDDDAPLQDLQLRLLDAMARREQSAPAPEPSAAMTATPGPSTVHGPFVTSVAPRPGFGDSVIGQDKVEVNEVSHSAFMAAQGGDDTVPMHFHAGTATASNPR